MYECFQGRPAALDIVVSSLTRAAWSQTERRPMNLVFVTQPDEEANDDAYEEDDADDVEFDK